MVSSFIRVATSPKKSLKRMDFVLDKVVIKISVGSNNSETIHATFGSLCPPPISTA